MRESSSSPAAPFSVVELLTVLALLGMLTAIVMPMLAAPKKANPPAASARGKP